MRLIDADDLRRNIDKSYPFDRDTQRKHDAYDIAKGMLLVIINKQPTVEPQRMRGRWIEDGYNDEKAVCDQCGEPCATYIMGKPRDKYCKWCGADMRGTE